MTTPVLTLTVDGQAILYNNTIQQQPLVRAVVISLFTWRRAAGDDPLPGDERFGWWGDTLPPVDNDRIGSRLWLLLRAKIVPETIERAKEYCREALQWLLDDGIAAVVEVDAERMGLDGLAIRTRITRRADGKQVDIRFDNAWSLLNVI